MKFYSALITIFATLSISSVMASDKCKNIASKTALNVVKASFRDASGTAKVFHTSSCGEPSYSYIAEVKLRKLPSNSTSQQHRDNSKIVHVKFKNNACQVKSLKLVEWYEGSGYDVAYGDCTLFEK